MTQRVYIVNGLFSKLTEVVQLEHKIIQRLMCELNGRLAFDKVASRLEVLNCRWTLITCPVYWGADHDERLIWGGAPEETLREYLELLLAPTQSAQSARLQFSLTCQLPELTVIVNQIMPLVGWSDQRLSLLLTHVLDARSTHEQLQISFRSGVRRVERTVTITLNPLE